MTMQALRLVDREIPPKMLILAVLLGGVFVAKAPFIAETSGYEQLIFACAVLWGFMLALQGITGRRAVIVFSKTFFVWNLVMVCALAQFALIVAGGESNVLVNDFVTDALVMLFPAAVAIAICTFTPTRTGLAKWLFVIAAMGLLAALVSWATAGGIRFRPPPMLTLAVVWAAASGLGPLGYSRRVRNYAWACLLLLLALSWFSQSRTAVIIWAVCGLLAYVTVPGRGRGRWAKAGVAGLLGIVVVVFVGSIVAGATAEFTNSRLAMLGTGAKDVSTFARIVEVQDVIETVGNSGPMAQLAGFGHGGSYVPSASFMEINLGENDRIHNVHNTQALVYLRYGLIGLLAYLALIVSIAIAAVREVRRRPDFLSRALLLSAAATILDAVVRNAFVDPSYIVTIACFGCLGLVHIRESRNVRS